MSQYQRFVSYVYTYQNEEKGRNVGFAKVEARNGQCRIYLSLKGIGWQRGASRKEISVWVCSRRQDESMERIFVGRAAVYGGCVEYRLLSPENNIGGSQKSLSSLCGILAGEDEDSLVFLTVWDDGPVWIAELLGKGKDGEWKPEAADTDEKLKAAQVEVPEEDCLARRLLARPTEERLPFEEPREEREEYQENHGESEENRAEEEITPILADDREERQQEVREEKGEDDLWAQLSKRFPKQQLRCEGTVWEVLRIKPQDIGLLDRENWVFGNNSFLLHGYYHYRHLILAKNKEEYILGVPGRFHNNEKFLASMFGFSSYMEDGKNGGYWYTPIKIGNNT